MDKRNPSKCRISHFRLLKWNFTWYFDRLLLLKVSKFEEKLTCGLENDMRNIANFHQSTRKSQNWNFHGILLSKVENVWAKNLQKSYVLWQWSMMQNLKRNWLVASKLTWGIWRILTQALKSLKNLHFNRLLLNKVYNVWAKKVQGSCFMTLESDAKFEEKLTCGLENDRRNLEYFYQSTRKSQNWDFDGILLLKVENVWT